MGEMPPDTPLVKTPIVTANVWRAFAHEIETEPEDGFRAYVRYKTHSGCLDASEDDLRLAFQDEGISLILVADAMTFKHPNYPVLCIDPVACAPSFRARAKHLWIVENNVTIGNLLFEEIYQDVVVIGSLDPQGF